MKPLHWDAINPFTGTPFQFDDPNLRFVNGLGVYLEPGDPGFATIQPKFTVEIIGNQVRVNWGWEGHGEFLDQCEIQVDRSQGWSLLAIDTTPGYTDTAPFPATPTKWKYRAIYRVGDAQVGLWSAEVSLTVGG